MASYAQGQPFNAGPVWNQMAFPKPGQGYGASQPYPLAGGYMDAVRGFLTNIPSDITGEDRMLYSLMGLQGLNAEQSRQANREFMQDMLKQRREESLEAKKLAREDAVMRSFLVDVPAAIGNAFSQGQRYAPERIQIAANAANRSLPGYGIPNYYSFVG
jgi:hypothetical protein